MASKTVLYIGFSFTDGYINELLQGDAVVARRGTAALDILLAADAHRPTA